MLARYSFDGSLLKDCTAGAVPGWIDLLRPEEQEIHQVDKELGLGLPTLEQMREIEISNRLYEEGGAYYMTFNYVADVLGDHPQVTPLTFVLKNDLLVTLRYKDMRIITHLTDRARGRGLSGSSTNTGLMLSMLESIVDLWADALEKNHTDIEEESHKVFETNGANRDHKQSLRRIARISDLNSHMRESLISLSRLHAFLSQIAGKIKMSAEETAKLRNLTMDVQSLLDHVGFVAGKISFLLDATLGLVNIEQNAIIKIFSVAAVIFLPPTLVASIYGMNFHNMPELSWLWGYPMAVVLMVLSAILPYWYFKRRGWL